MKIFTAQTAIFAAVAILAAALVVNVARDREALDQSHGPEPPRVDGSVSGTIAPPESVATSEEVFRKASPGVVTVKIYGGEDMRLLAQGSGVVVAPGTVVTNRHVVESGGEIRVFSQGQAHEASVLHADREYDMCSLSVPALSAAPVEMASVGTVRAGQRVYAIGAPRGLELSISGGLVSSIRPYGAYPLIQTDAPVSKGSSGGGLFDTDGRLVGVTTFSAMDGQNLNFALVSDLIPRLPARAADIRTLRPIAPIRSAEQIGDKEILDGIRDGRQAIAAIQAELRGMEEEIERCTSALNESRRSMDGFVASRDDRAYNDMVPRFNRMNGRRNELVSLYGQKRQEYIEMVERHNRLVERHNLQGRMQ